MIAEANDSGQNQGPGKKFPSMAKLRNKMCVVVAGVVSKRDGTSGRGRFVLPNCVTAGIRGMAHGSGSFTGFRDRENGNPNRS